MGATDLLSASQGEVLEVDMGQPISNFAAHVEELLSSKVGLLAAVGAAAAHKARSWTETANAEQLAVLVQNAMREVIVQIGDISRLRREPATVVSA